MHSSEIARLSDADQQALNVLVEHGYDLERVPAEHRERARHMLTLLSLLDTLPGASAPDLLTARTLDAVERCRQQERFTQQIQELTTARTPGGLSMREVAAVAAMVLVGVSLLWPVLSNARDVARQVTCRASLAAAGAALGKYAADFEGQMPATHARLGDPWWETNTFNADGTARSNSAHLFTLVRGGYIRLDQLGCADNPHAVQRYTPDMRDWPTAASVSFSYQNQYTTDKHRIDRDPPIAILADKNPFFEPGRFRLDLAGSNSLNHSEGQNVLLTTGEVRWKEEPVIDRGTGGDNIFHAGDYGLDYYTGTEGPASRADSFLVP